MLTQFRLAILAAATLIILGAGQAFAFWPFQTVTHLSFEPAYGGVCEECDLSGRILTGAKLSNSVFNRADFSRAVLARAKLSNSEFDGANFTDADLRNAVFADADVTGAIFERANIGGTDLADARGLTQDQLNDACGDHATRVPHGLHVRECD